MAKRSPVENRGTMEAAYENNLIDIKCDAENENSSRERSPQENTDNAPSLTPNTPRSTNSPSLKDTLEGKYIDQANLRRASLCSRRKTEEESTHLTQNERDETNEDKNIDAVTKHKEQLEGIASDSLEKEGNYEELVCLVRQFYVERPVNPAAIAYQNIETC